MLSIVIKIHFIKVIIVRKEKHLLKSIFLHTQKRLQTECQLLTWSIAVVQVQELKACAKATPLLEDLEAGAVAQVLVLVLLYKCWCWCCCTSCTSGRESKWCAQPLSRQDAADRPASQLDPLDDEDDDDGGGGED